MQANDLTAQVNYGIRTLTGTGLLSNNDTDLGQLATYMVGQYAAPEYRFDQIEVVLSKLNTTDQNTVLGLDLGSICKVIFTPNSVGSAITKYAKVISIGHAANLVEHRTTIGLGTLNSTGLMLDDVAFGNLDSNALAW